MSDRTAQRLVDGPLVRVFSVVCRAARNERSPLEWTERAEIVVPLRGCFMYGLGSDTCVADPRSAFVIGAEQEYRVSHPVDGGDECALLLVEPELLEEAFGDARTRHGRLSPQTLFAATALARTTPTALDGDERGLGLLGAIAGDLRSRRDDRIGAVPRRRVRKVQALLAQAPERDWTLAEIARRAGCSPYHLTRIFRTETGESIHRYLIALRLSIALQRLRAGEKDLARLAVDLGFAHHSHFSARFRAMFGVTPTEARGGHRRAA